MPDAIRPHDIILQSPPLRLRPLAEKDWDLLFRWNDDEEVSYFANGPGIHGYNLETMRQIYRDVSQQAFCFMIEVQDQPIGDRWLQEMNLDRILAQHPDERLWRIDMMIGEKDFWGKGLGTKAIGLLTEFGFSRQGADRIYACGIHADNPRSVRAFGKVGYVIVRQTDQDCDVCLTRDRYSAPERA